MIGLMFGTTVKWGGQARDAQRLSWRAAMAELWPQTLFGIAIFAVALTAVALAVLAVALPLLSDTDRRQLVWLGVVSLRSAARRHAAGELPGQRAVQVDFDPRRSLREGLLSNVLNPKAVVFYMAFLPQFIDPAGSAVSQSLFLAGLHFLIAMVWQCLLASVVDQARRWMQSSRVRRTLDGLTGSVMVIFGIKLASSS